MKKILIILAIALTTITLTNSCKKDYTAVRIDIYQKDNNPYNATYKNLQGSKVVNELYTDQTAGVLTGFYYLPTAKRNELQTNGNVRIIIDCKNYFLDTTVTGSFNVKWDN